ncbi:MAG: tRNA pseudouridine(38-40) synthase TruA [Bacteroidota bacterium]
MRNIKFIIEYDGTNYVGWQVQPNGPSVQQTLEEGLRRLLQENVQLTGAGRTDSGVHARGQVANCRVGSELSPDSLRRGLNALIPNDIVVLAAEEVPDSFHARNSARERFYRYQLALVETALERTLSWYVGGYTLDLPVMIACAAQIVGEHDFTSFSRLDAGRDNFLCAVQRAEWRREGSNLIFEISANRFLHGMVRTLVGTMVEIGRGHRPFQEFEDIIKAKDRRVAGMAAPAKGLFLEKIVY